MLKHPKVFQKETIDKEMFLRAYAWVVTRCFDLGFGRTGMSMSKPAQALPFHNWTRCQWHFKKSSNKLPSLLPAHLMGDQARLG